MNPNLTLFYGDNQLALKKEVAIWKNSFFTKYPDSSNFSEFKSPASQLQEIKNEIQTPPFLGEKRLIFLYNLQGALEDKAYTAFIKLLSTLPETTILLIIEENKIAKNAKLISSIKKIGNVKEFSISPSAAYSAAVQLCNKLQINFPQHLLKDLIQKLENNPSKIENEIIKLGLYCTPNAEVTTDEIDLLVKFSTQISVFELMDNITAKNTKRAIFNFNSMIDSGEEPTKIFYLLARQLRILIQILSLKNNGTPDNKIAELTGLHPFVLKKTLPSAKNFNIEKLKLALEKILEIDKKIKTGGIKSTKNDKTELLIPLEKVILELCEI